MKEFPICPYCNQYMFPAILFGDRASFNTETQELTLCLDGRARKFVCLYSDCQEGFGKETATFKEGIKWKGF